MIEPQELKHYVLYHSNCYDGFGAAYAVWKRLNNQAVYIPVSYGNPLPEMEPGSIVYIVDFSYPREVVLDLAEKMGHVYILDHHKTAEAALKDLEHKNLTIVFDMQKSGALLAWEFCHGPSNVPQLINHISDRDLWQFKLDGTKEIHEALVSYGMDFELWDTLSAEQLKIEGKPLVRLYNQLVNNVCEKAYLKNIAGHVIPVVNTSIAWSEIGNRLLELYPDAKFAASFTIFENEEMWSLRCRDGFDVSEIAKKYGGGGHQRAAGFKIPRK